MKYLKVAFVAQAPGAVAPYSDWLIIYFPICYRIVYREIKEDASEEEGRLTPVVTLYSRSGSSSVAGTTLSPSTPVPGTPSVSSCTVEDVLQLLRHLFVITTTKDKESLQNILPPDNEITPEHYTSKKITNKLLQQIQVSF